MIQVKKGVARLSMVGAVVLGALSLSACATQDYVDHKIAEVNDHINAVDAKATEADQKADQALSAAQAAQATANQDSQQIQSLSATVNTMQQAPPPKQPHG